MTNLKDAEKFDEKALKAKLAKLEGAK